MAKALNAVGRYREAITAADNALKFSKRLLAANLEKGAAYAGLGDKNNAILAYQEAAKSRPLKKYAEYQIEQLKK